ncbi:DNRLRE domain-containing protein [Blastococcus sp. KM273128]|nr:DNRLRE domain-containing protein [Blastococcus sp. KM273128]
MDTTLEFTDAGVQPVALTGELTFSSGGTQAMARLSDAKSATLRLDWDGPLPVPVLESNTATYRDVLPNVDLVLTATRVGFEQHVVVKQRPDSKTLAALRELHFPIAANGADVVESADGGLTLERGETVVGTAIAPVMWDARTISESDEPAALREVGLELVDSTKRGTDATLVLTPDQSLLTASDTVYPVTIDPTQALGMLGATFVQSSIVNTPQGGSTELRAGTYDGGYTVARSLLRFEVSAVKNRVVQSAKLALFETYAPSCSPRWVDIRDADDFDPNTVTWYSKPDIYGIVANAHAAAGYSSACPARWVDFNMTDWVQYYADSRSQTGNVMPLAITAPEPEDDSYSWKKFASDNSATNVPRLEFTYDGACDQYFGNRVCGAIRDKYASSGGPYGSLGLPTTSEACPPGGCYNHFEGGSIYWSPSTGAHVVTGDIRDKWAYQGWETGRLGFPTTDQICPPGGCYNHFQGGSIYWSPSTGAQIVRGAIRDKWGSQGWESGRLGFPTTDDVCPPGGCYNHFQGGSIYWSPSSGAHVVRGAIRDKWMELGAEAGPLGFPTTDDVCPPGGCYNHFAGGSVYWSPATGAHDVQGAIRTAWGGLGWEAGWLGFPTSDTLRTAGGARSEFQGGNIVFEERTGLTTVGAGALKHPTQFQRGSSPLAWCVTATA